MTKTNITRTITAIRTAVPNTMETTNAVFAVLFLLSLVVLSLVVPSLAVLVFEVVTVVISVKQRYTLVQVHTFTIVSGYKV